MEEVVGTLKRTQADAKFAFVAADDGGRDIFLHHSASGNRSWAQLEGRRLLLAVVDTPDGKRRAESILDIESPAASTTPPPVMPSVPTSDIFAYAKPGQYLSRWATINLRDHEAEFENPDGSRQTKMFKSCLPDLQKMLLTGEEWDFASERSAGEFRILENYLRFTFFRVYKQNRLSISKDGRFAVFNTGLVDNLFEPIFAVFLPKASGSKRPYKFAGFCCHGRGKLGRDIMAPFEYMPERAEFFTSINDVVLPRDIEVVEQWEHIIDDGVARGRYPWRFLKKFIPEGVEVTEDDVAQADVDDYGSNSVLRNTIEKISETANYREFKDKIESCIKTSLKRVEWNYKTAIPIYHPRQDKMSIALPLALFDSETADLALILEKKNARTYYASTVLTLDQAYLSARLVCRPLSDWLTTNIGSGEASIDE